MSHDTLVLFVGEKNSRRKIFAANLERVKKGQMAYDSGERSYDIEINCFGDLTFKEFGTGNTGFGSLG